jgi:glycosyltransferase involved in cell wall biosynthesis
MDMVEAGTKGKSKGIQGLKVAYLHTAEYHPMHGAYAKATGAEFIRIDKYLPYFYDKRKNRIKLYMSALINGLFSPARKYDVIITDEAKAEAAIIKLTSFRKKKLVATQASYTLTRVYEKKLSAPVSFLIRKIVNYYDALLCVGDEMYNIAKDVCRNNSKTFIGKIYNGVSRQRAETLSANKYDPGANTIVSIANCFSPETYHYKAIDIMIAVFDQLLKKQPDVKFLIIGNFIKEINDCILAKYSASTGAQISFVPFDKNINTHLARAILYLQLSRYETFGIAVSEAAFAGVPVFVSNQVGARVIMSPLDNKDDFIVESESITDAVKKIENFINLSPSNKLKISEQFKRIVQPYTEENAIRNYRLLFEQLFKK